MELKLENAVLYISTHKLLIVPYGIETGMDKNKLRSH